MRSNQFDSRRLRRVDMMLRFQSLVLASTLAFAPMGFAAERHNHQEDLGRHRPRRSSIAKAGESCMIV